MKLFETDFKNAMKVAMPGMLPEKVDPELKKWIATRAEMNDEKMAGALMRNLSDLDLKVLLKEAKVPVRCINSAGGFQFHTPTDIKINKKYADYDAVLMESIGHYPMLERPAEFNEKLRGVLKEFGGKK
jgi:pimeloyl-ACP methyl ester carboxylesterase